MSWVLGPQGPQTIWVTKLWELVAWIAQEFVHVPPVGPLFLLRLLQCCASVAAAMLLLLLQCCCCADAATLLQQNPKANGTTKPKHLTSTQAQPLAQTHALTQGQALEGAQTQAPTHKLTNKQQTKKQTNTQHN